jgi:iron(III) transport system ATP-binding protein
LRDHQIKLGDYSFQIENLQLNEDSDVLLSVRPEDFVLHKEDNASDLKGIVRDNYFLGLNTHQIVELKHNQQVVEIIQESSLEENLQVGQEVSLSIKTNKINVFSIDGTRNLLLKGK